MSNFIENVYSCRVDFWTINGKWKYTEAVIFRKSDYSGKDCLIHEALRNALKDSVPNNYHGLRVTCLEPYHEYSHPISLIWKG